MDTNILAITKIGLGVVLGVSIGVLLRFILIKLLLIIGIPVGILFFLDYANLYRVGWLQLQEKWRTVVIPPVIEVYAYFSNHVLVGIVPGIAVGLCLGFILTRKLV